jgi:hypothetical protein
MHREGEKMKLVYIFSEKLLNTFCNSYKYSSIKKLGKKEEE